MALADWIVGLNGIMSGQTSDPKVGLLGPVLEPSAGRASVLGQSGGGSSVDPSNPFVTVGGPAVGVGASGGSSSFQNPSGTPGTGSWQMVGSGSSDGMMITPFAGGNTTRGGSALGAFGGAGYSPDASGTVAVSVDVSGRSRAMIAVEGSHITEMNNQYKQS